MASAETLPTLDELLQAAVAARAEFEAGDISTLLLARLYQSYNHVPRIGQFIGRAREMFPHLNCGLASVYLRHKLGRGDIVIGKYGNSVHSFLKVDGYIVDITADQYGGEPIYVGPLTSPWAIPDLAARAVSPARRRLPACRNSFDRTE